MPRSANTPPATPKSENIFDVPRLNSFGSRLLARRGGLMVKLANLESSMLGDQIKPDAITDPIFVCGLARSGTTILLELLAQHGDTASQRYLDFPFVFTPYFWNRYLGFARRGPVETAERSHKDGLLVSDESPEAMEEPLWMRFFPEAHDPSVSTVLDETVDHPDFERFYRAHMAKLLEVRGRSRYLAKGNYHIARLAYLLKLFPEARFIVPVRDPVSHIASSMKQHRLFSLGQQQNPDARLYLQQVGHFEFGLDRRPINIDAEETRNIAALWGNEREVEGWAHYWAMIHSYLADTLESKSALGDRVFLISYEALCSEPLRAARLTADFCKLAEDDIYEGFASAQIKRQTYYAPDFSDEECQLIRSTTSGALNRLKPLFRF